MIPFKAIIFDMDGVIVDSEPRHERSFLEIFHELDLGEDHGIDFTAYYGKSDRAVWIDFIEKHQPAFSLAELTDRKQRRFLQMIGDEQPIFPGLPALVEKLTPEYKLAVASGSAHAVIDDVLAINDLRRFFPVVVSAQDVDHGKPAPDIFLRTAELLQVEPTACCVIEDAAAGVDAALAAEMSVIAITNTLPKEKLNRATHIVHNYEEIKRLLV